MIFCFVTQGAEKGSKKWKIWKKENENQETCQETKGEDKFDKKVNNCWIELE